MNLTDFDLVVERMRELQDELLAKKGADYTRHDPDRLANFKRQGRDLNILPLIAWAIYAGKHWDAIMSYVKTGRTESEELFGRFVDLQNYLYLGMALIEEESNSEECPF